MSRLYDTWGARDWRRYCAFLLGRRLYVSCASLLSGSLCSETVATPVHSSFPGACFAGRYVERRLCGRRGCTLLLAAKHWVHDYNR